MNLYKLKNEILKTKMKFLFGFIILILGIDSFSSDGYGDSLIDPIETTTSEKITTFTAGYLFSLIFKCNTGNTKLTVWDKT